MNRRHNLAATWLTIVLGAGIPAAFADAPRSGHLHTVSYTVGSKGNRIGDPVHTHVWFSEGKTLHSSTPSATGVSVEVVGQGAWTSLPKIGRIVEAPPTTFGPTTYPDYVKRIFELKFGRRPFTEVMLDGRRCWKYAWHDEGAQGGDVRFPPQDVTYWVLADKEFPIILRSESSLGSRSEVVEFQQNIAVPESLFQKPANLRPILPIRIPPQPFQVAITSHRASSQYGWKTEEQTLFSSDGSRVVRRFTSVNTPARGEQNTFTAPNQPLTVEQGKVELHRELQFTPYGTSKVGSETLLGLPCDIVKTTGKGFPIVTYWVGDHPLFGTVCLKRVTEEATDTTVMQLKSIGLVKPTPR